MDSILKGYMINLRKRIGSNQNMVTLTTIRLIDSIKDHELLLSFIQEYAELSSTSPLAQFVGCSLLTSALLQKRIYFGLGRPSGLRLIKSDPNIRCAKPSSCNAKQWNAVLRELYTNDIIELVYQGQEKNTSIYKIKEPVVLIRLESEGVDAKAQYEQCLIYSPPKILPKK